MKSVGDVIVIRSMTGCLVYEGEVILYVGYAGGECE